MKRIRGEIDKAQDALSGKVCDGEGPVEALVRHFEKLGSAAMQREALQKCIASSTKAHGEDQAASALRAAARSLEPSTAGAVAAGAVPVRADRVALLSTIAESLDGPSRWELLRELSSPLHLGSLMTADKNGSNRNLTRLLATFSESEKGVRVVEAFPSPPLPHMCIRTARKQGAGMHTLNTPPSASLIPTRLISRRPSYARRS